MAEFVCNIILKGKMECLTGIHIGGSKEKFEIGGVDSPVIRDPLTNYPYIPGSSLKGKMRSLLAFELGIADKDPDKLDKKDYNNDSIKDNILIRIFGVGADDKEGAKGIGPTRLIVRDAFPDKETIKMWENLNSELLYTEYKPENSINRLTSAANPRFLERIAKGSIFNVEFIFGIYDVGLEKKDVEFFKQFITALRLLEHSFIGGSGSRGYGQVAFKFHKPFVLTKKDYEEGGDNFKLASKSIDDLIEINKIMEDEEQDQWWKRLSKMDETYIIENVLEKIPEQSNTQK